MKIGGIYAEIRAKRDKLRGDLDAAGRDVESAAVGMNRSIAKISFRSLGIAAAAFGAAMVSAVASGVKSMAELERKMLRTESIIKATGDAAQLSSEQLLNLANRLDLATLQDRDAILDAINAMQTFRTVSGATFERSIALSVDLAEVLGTDLRSQVVQLGKALEDPITGLSALRRVGVSFNEQQKEQIKTLVESNRLLEAQGIILDGIAIQVGGAAEGAAGGLSGKVDTLNARWRNFKELLAESSGAAKAAASAIDTLSSALAHLSEMMKPDQNKQFENAIAGLEQRIKIYEKLGGAGHAMVGEIRARISALQSDLNALPLAADQSLAQQASVIVPPSAPTSTTGTPKKAGSGSGVLTDIPDFWRYQAAEQYEAISRMYDYQIQSDQEVVDQREMLWEDYTDFWQLKHDEQYEVMARGYEAQEGLTTSFFQSLTSLSQRTADAMQTNFSDLFFDAITGELDSFRDYASAIFNSIARAWSDMMGQMIAKQIFGEDFGGGGWLSGLSSLFGGGKAIGGPVRPGMSYLIGERGPELLTMGSSGGAITPNNALGGVNITQSFDFRGADATAIPRLKEAAKQIRNETLAAVARSLKAGGQLYNLSRG